VTRPLLGAWGGLPPEVVEAWLADFATVKRLDVAQGPGDLTLSQSREKRLRK
jgi:hypothetical protein